MNTYISQVEYTIALHERLSINTEPFAVLFDFQKFF